MVFCIEQMQDKCKRFFFAQHAAYFLSTLALSLCNKEKKKKNAELPTDSVDKLLDIFYIDSYFTY